MIDLRFSEAELEARIDHLTTFILEQKAAAGADGVVLGLSGGIDSTTVATLAVEALGTDAVHGLVLPAQVSSEDNMSDAERVAQDLDISYDVCEVEPVIDALLAAYPEAEGDHLAVGNARARVRSVFNYLVANHENRLVLGTGNRSEAAVGYFTKYGDGAVDCHPIGNLYKQQVRQVAAALGVPEELVQKTPTAELWADQTDEDELGIDYDTLDAILATHIDGGVPAAAAADLLAVDLEVIEMVQDLHVGSAHKRAAPPAPEPPGPGPV